MNRDVIILPSFMKVESWRKRHASESPEGLFGQVVTTFDAWIADLWELHGDGRALVDGVRREITMQAVFEGVGGEFASPGFAPLAANCMRRAAGVPSFERAVEEARGGSGPECVSSRERAVLAALARYEDAIGALGLVEPGQAAALLAQGCESVFPRPLRVAMPDAAPLSWVQQHFFDRCSQRLDLDFLPAAGVRGVRRAPEGVRVRFAFPSGRLAEPGVVADIVRACDASGGVVVVCKDPLALYEQLECRLAEDGFTLCVQAGKPFSHTEFGRVFLALYHCLHDDPWDPALLSDAVLSPFSGFSRADASRIDRELRGDRLADREEWLTQLYARCDSFSQLGEIAADPDADVLVGVFEQMACSSARPSAWKAEQLAAMSALRSAAFAARAANAGIGACAAVLERASLPVAFQVGDGPKVTVTTQFAASQMEPGCCSALVIADLTAEDYPVADREDASSTLLEKLGLPPEEGGLSRARRAFSALLAIPTSQLYLVRPLGDANADETYPSVVLEEFVDAYRDDPSAVDDLDNAYRLPAFLQEGLVERGEEDLYANAAALPPHAGQPAAVDLPWPRIDDVGEARARAGMLTLGDGQGEGLRISHVSPSQIEVYLECPYRWFATQRLRPSRIDEGFGAVERGSFAHAALKRFYCEFDHVKVSPANIEEARSLMRSVLDALVLEQPQINPLDEGKGKGERRLVAADELERREVQALCDQLIAYLDYEAILLPTFRPAYLEEPIGNAGGVSYAGYPFVGTVDRIDVDDAGRAVIIDYKSSVTDEHEIGGKTFGYAGKVQTRVYAQVVKRALGLDVVGVLYVGYGRKRAVAGAYDPRVLEAVHLPEMRHANCVCGLMDEVPDPLPDDFTLADLSFERMLDETENLAAQAIVGMAAGSISPNPSSAKACEFCPVLACPKRGA